MTPPPETVSFWGGGGGGGGARAYEVKLGVGKERSNRKLFVNGTTMFVAGIFTSDAVGNVLKAYLNAI